MRGMANDGKSPCEPPPGKPLIPNGIRADWNFGEPQAEDFKYFVDNVQLDLRDILTCHSPSPVRTVCSARLSFISRSQVSELFGVAHTRSTRPCVATCVTCRRVMRICSRRSVTVRSVRARRVCMVMGCMPTIQQPGKTC